MTGLARLFPSKRGVGCLSPLGRDRGRCWLLLQGRWKIFWARPQAKRKGPGYSLQSFPRRAGKDFRYYPSRKRPEGVMGTVRVPRFHRGLPTLNPYGFFPGLITAVSRGFFLYSDHVIHNEATFLKPCCTKIIYKHKDFDPNQIVIIESKITSLKTEIKEID